MDGICQRAPPEPENGTPQSARASTPPAALCNMLVMPLAAIGGRQRPPPPRAENRRTAVIIIIIVRVRGAFANRTEITTSIERIWGGWGVAVHTYSRASFVQSNGGHRSPYASGGGGGGRSVQEMNVQRATSVALEHYKEMWVMCCCAGRSVRRCSALQSNSSKYAVLILSICELHRCKFSEYLCPK